MKAAGLSTLAAVVLVSCLPKLEPPPEAANKPVPIEAERKGVLWQETFERPDIASLGWGSPSKSNERELETVFRIVAEGDDHFLRARHDGRPETDGPEPPHFGRVWEEDALKLSEACQLSWRWRVRQHPAPHEDQQSRAGAVGGDPQPFPAQIIREKRERAPRGDRTRNAARDGSLGDAPDASPRAC